MLTTTSSTPWLLHSCLLVLMSGTSSAQPSRTNQIRMTTSGRVRGYIDSVAGLGQVEHYLGIPYAEPPVGKLRFAKPVSVKAWSGVKDTQKFSATCWQYLATAPDLRNPAAAVWLNNTHMSEDCLYLNIWVPRGRATKRKAMLVWIYGGGFCGGSANLDIYNGAVLAASNDIVVASMQYRVGALGFLSLRVDPKQGGRYPETGNAGLWDQNLAMAWLKRNAEYFNADPARITLKGESAGAVSVSMHLLSPHSHNLFDRAILHSGSFLGPWSLVSKELAHRRAINLAYAVGCVSSSQKQAMVKASKEDIQNILTCLRGVDAFEFVNKLGAATEDEPKYREEMLYERRFSRAPDDRSRPYDLLSVISFVPVLDGAFFPLSPDEAYKRRLLKKAPLLLGVNQDEGSYFLFYYMPPFTSYGAKMDFANISEKVLTRDPADYISDFILPLNYLYPEVLDEILLTYTVPSRRLFPFLFQKANKTDWVNVLDDITGDMNFKCCILRLGDWYTEQGNDVYIYNFEHRTKSNTFPSWTGTMHGYELEYTFGMPLSPKFEQKHYRFTDAERKLSQNMMTRWSNFVKMGNPNLNEDGSATTLQPKWPVYNMLSEKVLRFQTSDSRERVVLGTNTRRRYCQLWMKLVPNLSARLENITCSRSVNANSAMIPYPLLIILSMLTVWTTADWRTVLTLSP